jgi:galactoside O-acetyltransferase
MKLWKDIANELVFWFDSLMLECPGSIGQKLRAWYLRQRLGALGPNAKIGRGMEISGTRNIRIGGDFIALGRCQLCAVQNGRLDIGSRVSLASNVVLDAGDEGHISIGDDSGVAHNGVLRASRHHYEDPNVPFKAQGHEPGSIIIDEDVWVAPNCVLLPGTHIEKGCIVASGSIVGGVVKSYSIVAGNPARVIGKRGG